MMVPPKMAPLLLLITGVTAALKLTPPENVWARAGESNVTLLCVASERIRSCSWSSPYGKVYPLESGLMAEGGRLLHAGTGRHQCGLVITSVEARDEGRWSCNVGVVENSEVTTASGMASLSLATPPSSLTLSSAFARPESNLTAGRLYKVACVATAARPKPTFTWLLNGEAVTGLETMDEEETTEPEGLATFTQRLLYTPALWHANRTLTCTASHPGLPSPLQAATKVLLTGRPVSSTGFPLGGVIAIVVVVLVTLLGLLAVYLRRRLAGGRDQVVDAETAKEEEGKEEEKEDKDAEEPTGGLRARLAAILASVRPEGGKKVDDTVASEWEKVELVEEDEKAVVEESGDKEKEKEKIGNRVTALLARLKPERKKKEVKEDVKEETKEEDNKEEEAKEEEDKVKDKVAEDKAEEKPARRGSETPV